MYQYTPQYTFGIPDYSSTVPYINGVSTIYTYNYGTTYRDICAPPPGIDLSDEQMREKVIRELLESEEYKTQMIVKLIESYKKAHPDEECDTSDLDGFLQELCAQQQQK